MPAAPAADRTPAAIIEPLAAASAGGHRADLRVVDHPDPGWVSLAELTCPIRTAERRGQIGRAAGPGAPARLAEAWDIEAIGWFLGVMVGGSLIQGMGLLASDPDSTWARIGSDGLAEGLAVAAGTPAVAARPSTARPVLTELLRPVIETRERTSARLLWWHAGDRLADALLWCGEALGAEDRVPGIAAELLAPGVPYCVPLRMSAEGYDRDRHTCCLSRRTAAGETCDGCPHQRKRRSAR